MKRSQLLNDALREIKHTGSRFVSLMVLSALAVCFLAGLRVTAPDMKHTADQFFDQQKLMDLHVLSTLGLTEDDVEVLGAAPGVELAEGAYTVDAIIELENNDYIVKVLSISTQINAPHLTQGRMPQQANECLVEPLFLKETGYQIGDSFTLNTGTGTFEDTLTAQEYTIVGVAESPLYIGIDRGSSTLGTGRVMAYILLPEAAFDMDYYTDIYLLAGGTMGMLCYSDEYEDAADELIDSLEELRVEREQHRYDEIKDEAEEKLADAQQEYDDAEAEVNQELADARQELADARQELDDGWQEYHDGLETLEQETVDAQKEIDDGEKELADALKKLQDGERDYLDGRQELDDGWVEYNDGLAELEDGRWQYEDGRRQYEDGLLEYEDARQVLEDGRQKYEDGLKEYEDGLEKYNDGLRDYRAGERELDSGWSAYYSGVAQLEEQKAALGDYDANLAQVQSGLAQAQAELVKVQGYVAAAKDGVTKAQIDLEAAIQSGDETETSKAQAALSAAEAALGQAQQGETLAQAAIDDLTQKLAVLEAVPGQIAAAQAQLDSAYSELCAGDAELADAWNQLRDAKRELDDAKIELDDAKAEIEDGEKQLDDAWAELEDSRLELEDARKELEDGQRELDDAYQTLEDGERELADARQELDDGWQEYRDGQKELADARVTLQEETEKAQQELADALVELEDGEAEYADGVQEYEDGVQEAEEELADAREKLADARKEIDELEECDWYILGRNTNSGYVSYSMDADRMGNLAAVFPLIFFLVAALVCLTTMTRMVEEQRVTIGGMKALGYSKGAIAVKYVGYGFLASAIGSLIGLAVGLSLLPWIICNAWAIIYTVGEVQYGLEPVTSVLACLAAIGTVTLSALVACFSTLTAVPAQLMRPKAPPMGKRILLERITPLWRRLSFNYKVSLRNLFRYQKRFWMTVIGIGGCAALIVTAFGLRGSIFDVMDKQYDELYYYSGQVGLVDKVSAQELDEVIQSLDASPLVENWMLCRNESVSAETDRYTVDCVLQVVEDQASLEQFVNLRHRLDDTPVVLPDDGVVLTEKMSILLGVKVGDTFTLDADKRVSVRVADITEHYIQHYIYMSQAYYTQLMGEAPADNVILLDYPAEAEEAAGLDASLVALDGVTSMTRITDTRKTFTSSLESVDYAVVLIIVCAAALAFVVLYNLTNINITERTRELATLKVLGFYDGELSAYVYRENVFLTVFGVLMGLVMGKFLHQWLILTVEIDLLMFGRTLKSSSYLYAVVLTVIFSLLVNLSAHRKLKKLDMVESLKTVE